MKIILALIIGAVLVAGFLTSCSTFGTAPDEERKEVYSHLKNYDSHNHQFSNPYPVAKLKSEEEGFSFSLLKEFFFGGKKREPREKLPDMKPDFQEFLKPSSETKSIWFGHSTFLLNMNGKIILVDPVFSDHASPIPFSVKRFQDPVAKLNELPDVDFILISHDHYDHLDMKTIKFFKNKKAKFITPLGVGAHIIGWGIDAVRVIEKNWWESEKFDDLEFIATPAQHFSGRKLEKNNTLWSSWVIRNKTSNIYFSGDSGYNKHFKDIGDLYGPFDIAYMETGQYNERWAEVHLLPQEGIKAFKDLRAKRYFPIHWAMFDLSLHTWDEPIKEITKIAQDENVTVITPKIGQLFKIDEKLNYSKWWLKDQQEVTFRSSTQPAQELLDL